MNNKVLGISGELDAKEYLENLDYDIIARNKKIAGVEIDIVAKIDDIIVFCEVKTRDTDKYGCGVEAIDQNRIRRYLRAGKVFMVDKKYQNCSLRFDVIEINHGKINHIIDAFRG